MSDDREARDHAAEAYRLAQLDPPTLRRSDVARLTGVEPAQSVRWWRALGFAEVDDDEPAFRAADVEVVKRLGQLVGAGLLDDADVLRIARVLSTSFSRIVDAQLDVVDVEGDSDEVEDEDGSTKAESPAAGLAGLNAQILELMESSVVYVWRRHLLAAIGQRLSVDRAERAEAVVFADLSGFSRVSKYAGHDELAHIIETFEVVAFDVVSSHGGRVVKLIGDEVMFVFDSLDVAVEAALDLIQRLAASDGMPPLHCGVAFGPTVGIGGDVFGPTVNLASRLTSVARAGTVVTPRQGGEAFLERNDIDARRIRRSVDLKGIGRTSIVSIRPLAES